MCPRPLENHSPSRLLSGIKLFKESRSTPLLVLPQSKLIENTTKYIQSKLYVDKP